MFKTYQFSASIFVLVFIFSTKAQLLLEKSNVTVQNNSMLRIVRGWPVKLGAVPYQVSFKVKVSVYYESFCGGTLISGRKILTAAHCFADQAKGSPCSEKHIIKSSPLARFVAVMGNIKNRAVYEEGRSNQGQWRRIENFTRPIDYAFPLNDIGIVFVKSSFKFDSNVSPIPYATVDEEYKGMCLVTGFGLIGPNEHSPKSKVLLAGSARLGSQYMCAQLFMRKLKKEICSLLDEAYPARGDSGGPLVCKGTSNSDEDSEKGILVGIVSSYLPGRACSFTRVSSFKNYIALNGFACNVTIDVCCVVLAVCFYCILL